MKKNIKNSIIVLLIYFIVYTLSSNLLGIGAMALGWDAKTHIILQFIADVLVFSSIIFFSKELLQGKRYEAKLSIEILKYYVLMGVTNVIVNMFIMLFTTSEDSINQQALQTMTEQNTLYMFFSIVIFAPIVEEFVFRGAIYKSMRNKFGVLISLLTSSLAFASMHFVLAVLEGNFQDFIFLPAYIAPGIVLGLIYEKTDNIYAPIVLHSINNIIAFSLMVFGG